MTLHPAARNVYAAGVICVARRHSDSELTMMVRDYSDAGRDDAVERRRVSFHEEGGRTVVVVDDDDAVRNLVATVLVEAGYRVRTAENGRQALALLDRECPAAVLMDVNMPLLDGLAACRAMRGDERLNAVPVVIMSAVPVDRARLNACRADRFLSKPFDIDRLIDEVASCVATAG